MGLFLFNIFLIDLFLIIDDVDLASYPDDNTPYVTADNADEVIDSFGGRQLTHYLMVLKITFFKKIMIIAVYQLVPVTLLQ